MLHRRGVVFGARPPSVRPLEKLEGVKRRKTLVRKSAAPVARLAVGPVSPVRERRRPADRGPARLSALHRGILDPGPFFRDRTETL